MSIPKEPRQLMINLMYLVLTAMLALNVSAEIINAFFAIDEGNQSTMQVVNQQLEATEQGLIQLLKDPSKERFRPLGDAVKSVRGTSAELHAYIEELRQLLIDEAGNRDGTTNDQDFTTSYGMVVPTGKKDKDVTTRLLVDEGKGAELEAKIKATRERLLAVYTQLLREHGPQMDLKPEDIEQRIQRIEQSIPLRVDEAWKESEKKSWAEFKFKQMPLAAVLPILSQIQTNAQSTEATMVNHFVEIAGGRVIDIDQFFPIVNAERSYVIKGEPFKARISLGAYSSQLDPKNVEITVNGRPVQLGADGLADFSQIARETGSKRLVLESKVTNPLTGKVITGSTTYEYEVGMRSASVAADKMNVFYIGVDNPITLSAAGVPSEQLRVQAEGATISGSGARRTVQVKRQGEAKIILSGGGLAPTTFNFRVKPIPNPEVKLGGKMDGVIRSADFRVQPGLYPELKDFVFDAKCDIQSYTLFYTPKGGDPIRYTGQGRRFTGEIADAVRRAKAGDDYVFTEVKAKCPGDVTGRRVNGLAFKIR